MIDECAGCGQQRQVDKDGVCEDCYETQEEDSDDDEFQPKVTLDKEDKAR